MFVGGGNPTCIGLEKLKRLVDIIMPYLPDKSALQEWTFESNPETLTGEMVDFLATLPSIRLSIGIQRLNDHELSVLGRRASMDAVNRAMDMVFSRVQNVGGDFIMGVPGCPSLAGDLHNLVEKYPFSHVSAYFLTVEENTPLQRSITSGLLPDPADIDATELYEIRDALVASGFEHYEISNYARPGFRCRHNLNYWRPGSYIGLGPAAVSSADDIRLSNVADLSRWLTNEAPALEKLSQKDRRNEHLMLRLRLLLDGLDIVDFERHFGRQADEFYTTLTGQIDSGNLLRYDNLVRLTDQGLRIADEVMASLFI
ncbi:MAG: coproporphyrinogen III oxidase [uncultured bacterium]|nr:MAG: coproporphyrinogen III oxidase [uncultured bacterium]